jgi:hypothetical protein
MSNPGERLKESKMDQRPRNDLPPTSDDPPTDRLGAPRNRTAWDRATRTEEGDWNVLPLLIIAALIAIGAWLLFASDRASVPEARTTEHAPTTTESARPGSNMNAAPQTKPSTAPAPATKP